MNLEQALQRIEELERRVRELESRPVQHIHHHYAPQPIAVPVYEPQPYWKGPVVVSSPPGSDGYGESWKLT